MKRINRPGYRPVLLLIILAAFSFFHCDTFFTFSPLSSLLARDPVYLNKEEKVDYARAALSGRKTDAMKKAVEALELDLALLSPAEILLAGQLCMVLSGTEAIIGKVMTGDLSFDTSTIDPLDPATLVAFIAPYNDFLNGLVPGKTYLIKAAGYYAACSLLSGTDFRMSGTDYFLGCMLNLFSGALAYSPPNLVQITNTQLDIVDAVAAKGLTYTESAHMAVPLIEGVQDLSGVLRTMPP